MFEKPHRLHPASIVINFGTYFISTVKSLAAPIAGIFLTGRSSQSDHTNLIIGGIAALVGAISVLGTVLHYFSTTFFIDGDALIISSGFIWRKRRTIPLARIQNVNVERTIWHRILKAAAVKVETAAGHKGEGDLTALSISDANNLQAVLLHHRSTVESTEALAKPEALYSLSPRQVILAGALGNRAIYIIGSIMAVLQVEGSHRYFRPLFAMIEKLGPTASAMVGAASVLGFIIVGWLMSIIISATRYYGFRIDKHDRGLLLTHGLITQFKSIIPVGRIQDVRIVEPILFRLLGYCEIYADTAGSFDKKDVAAANKICPILPERSASDLGKLLMPEFEFERLYWNRVSRKTIGRFAWRHFAMYSILVLTPLAFWVHWYALFALIPLAIGCLIAGYFHYQYVGYAWTSELLASRRGVFRKQAILIPFDRVQHYTIRSSLVQRWLGLATVTAVSASTGGHSISITDVEVEAVERIRQTIGTSIQQHIGSRRSGL